MWAHWLPIVWLVENNWNGQLPLYHPHNWWQLLLFLAAESARFWNVSGHTSSLLALSGLTLQMSWFWCTGPVEQVLCSSCTSALADIIIGSSSGHQRVGEHFSLPHRLVGFKNNSYQKCIAPMSFYKAVGQIEHIFGTIETSFFSFLFFNGISTCILPFFLYSVLGFCIFTHTHTYIFFFKLKLMALYCSMKKVVKFVHCWWSTILVWQTI